MNRASVFEWHNRFKEGTESVRDDGRCGRSKQVHTTELIGQRVMISGLNEQLQQELEYTLLNPDCHSW